MSVKVISLVVSSPVASPELCGACNHAALVTAPVWFLSDSGVTACGPLSHCTHGSEADDGG